jgi:hypothetical protein
VREYLNKLKIIWVVCIGFSVSPLQAQQIIIGSAEEDSLRAAQLSGSHDPNVSFAVRPLELKPGEISWKKLVVKALPLTLITQFNSQRPFGWNDGAMIQARGLQVMGRAGFYARYGIVEMQAAPEWVYAVNTSYNTSMNWGSNAGGVYNKFFPGQSSVGIRLGAVSMGVSTQNLWWGPGQRSSLLMSNNAPGFLHVYIRSNRPAKTPIGTFEWQLIGARLDSDSTRPYENFHLKTARESYPSTWRYQSAFVISYQPKWIPGLFLGMTRTLQRYQQDIGLAGGNWLKRYVPVLTKAFQKKNEPTDDAENTDQLASFFFRWVMPKSGWEFYGEWGYNDYKQNVRDYLMDATHSAAYILGVSKLFQSGKSQILIGVETLKQSETPSSLLRGAGNWYVHGGDNGYTHQNQIIGAGVGYGSDLISFRLKYQKNESPWQLLLNCDRIHRDPSMSQNQWVDISYLVEPTYRMNNYLIRLSINLISSKNVYWVEEKDKLNLSARLQVTYTL